MESLHELRFLRDSPPHRSSVGRGQSYDAELILRAFRKEGLANDVVWLKDGVAVLDLFSGQTAMRRLPRCAVKLVLLDLKLSKVDGQEVLRRIKSDPRTRAIPVVVLSSRARNRTLTFLRRRREQLRRQTRGLRQVHRDGETTGPVLADGQPAAQPPNPRTKRP